MRLQYYRIPNVHDQNSRGIPRGVVVADATGPDTVDIGVSITNPIDQFTRKMGRLIAQNRLRDQPITLSRNDILNSEPPKGSVFERKRFRSMWPLVRIVVDSELRYRNRKNLSRGAD
jgi:hypothetical protein